MSIKETFGEISKKDLINLGDKVTVKYFDKSGQSRVEEVTGILINATTEKIRINGTVPSQDINVENILEIIKVK